MAAQKDYNNANLNVRGLIYDCLLSEGTSDELNEKHGLVEKPMPRWQDNLFMCLRLASTRMDEAVLKVDGKRSCILSSCLNVGKVKVQAASRSFGRNEPHTYQQV